MKTLGYVALGVLALVLVWYVRDRPEHSSEGRTPRFLDSPAIAPTSSAALRIDSYMGALPDKKTERVDFMPALIRAEFPRASLSEAYQTLVKRVAAGDKREGFKAWLIARRCTTSLKNLVGAYGKVYPSSEQYPSGQQLLGDLRTDCAELTSIRDSDRYVLIRDAAMAGDLNAMSVFRSEGPLGGPNVPSTDPNFIEWDRASIQYLGLAAAQGDWTSAIRLGNIYEAGTPTTPVDLAQALTYELLAQHQFTDIGNVEAVEDDQRNIDRLAARLTSGQAEMARDRAKGLIAAFPAANGS